MYLSQHWFDTREQEMAHPRSQGHTDLGELMHAMGRDAEQLMAAGVLRCKAMRSTAELLDREATHAFRKHFLVRKAYDILMLKSGRGMAFVKAVGVAAKPKKSANFIFQRVDGRG